MTGVPSVLTAEAAALALAALISERLGFQQVNFLSDNQQLINFLHDSDNANPPDWTMKYYTQMFYNSTQSRSILTRRIQRAQNQAADALAKQALANPYVPPVLDSITTCISDAHTQCTLSETLSTVSLNSVCLLAASCC
jgi:ribonuclease HI